MTDSEGVRKKLQVKELLLEEKAQTRVILNQQVVHDYAAQYRLKPDKGRRPMPDPEVFEVAGTGFVVIDGIHRTAAMRMAGVSWCWAQVVGKGSMEDAIWAALERNHRHGLMRSNDDKRRAVGIALDHPRSKNLSARLIGEHCGVGDDLVLDIRKEREARTQLPGPDKVQGKDGKMHPAKRPSARATPEQQQRGQLRLVKDDEGETETQREVRREMTKAAEAASSASSSAKPNGNAVPSDSPVTAAMDLLRTARLAIQKLGRESPHVHTLLEQAAKQVAGIEEGLDAERPTACPACGGAGCTKCASRGWVGLRVAKMMGGAKQPDA